MTALSFRSDVSALYVNPAGPYPGLVADWWDADRDAMRYEGPNPVVAHPPCGPWGALRQFGAIDGKECGPRAVEQVRRWGGVMEHPESSALWAHCGLPRPGEAPDAWGGRTILIEQRDFGHAARKRTWLYVVGTDPDADRPPVLAHPDPGVIRPAKGKKGQRWLTKYERAATPYWLAQWLVELAGRCRPMAAAPAPRL